jgi:copper resistance protein C
MSTRRAIRRLCGAVLLAAVVPPLVAHAILLEASPAKDGSVAGPSFTIQLKFNSRIDGARSQVTLVLPDKTSRTLTIEKQSAPDTLSAKAASLQAGVYRLRWQVLASDGHITRGEYSFSVR